MLAWDAGRECDKSNPASESPQETLKAEQQNSAAPPAESQAGGTQLSPQVPRGHFSAALWVKLLSFFGTLREISVGEASHASPSWAPVPGGVCRQQLRQAAHSAFREHFAPCVPGEGPQNT